MNEASRRRFLASTAAVSTGALLGGTQVAAGADYETIAVGAGETFTKRLGDGETWENKLIDVSASGAAYDIRAVGDNWAIRNIGVRGPMDVQGGQDTDFIVRVNSPDATGVIENIYLGYETTFTRSDSTSPMGLFVHAYHEGDLEVRNFYCRDMPSHAIYGSGPGNPDSHPNPGGQGTVRIHDSYAADLENSGWRIGTPGSYVENSVCFRAVRGIWAYYDGAEARGCDLGENNTDIVVGNGSWDGSGDLTVENTRFSTSREVDTGNLVGSSAGTPQERVPDACPTSPEEAASGASGGDDTGGGGTPSDGDGSSDSGYDGEIHPGAPLDDDENALVFSGTHLDSEDPQISEYTLAVSEQLLPSRYNNATVDDDFQISEGGTRVDGSVANWKDAYVFTGEITTLTVDGPAKVFLNGEEIDPSKYGVSDGESDDSQGDTGTGESPDDGTGNDDTGSDHPSGGDERPGESPTEDPEFGGDWIEEFLNSLFGDEGTNDIFGSMFD